MRIGRWSARAFCKCKIRKARTAAPNIVSNRRKWRAVGFPSKPSSSDSVEACTAWFASRDIASNRRSRSAYLLARIATLRSCLHPGWRSRPHRRTHPHSVCFRQCSSNGAPCRPSVAARITSTSRFYAQAKSRKENRSSVHAFPPHRPLKRFSFCRQNSQMGRELGRLG